MLHGCIAAVGVTVRNPTSYGIAFFDVRGKVSTSTVENNVFISSPGEHIETSISNAQ